MKVLELMVLDQRVLDTRPGRRLAGIKRDNRSREEATVPGTSAPQQRPNNSTISLNRAQPSFLSVLQHQGSSCGSSVKVVHQDPQGSPNADPEDDDRLLSHCTPSKHRLLIGSIESKNPPASTLFL